jgi:hypothetical protein
MKERECWWAFLSGKPAEEWDPPKKSKQNQNARKFQRGMRAFADDNDDPRTEGPSAGSSRDEAREMRPMNDDTEASPPLSGPSDSSAGLGGTPIYKPREPTPSLLRLIDQVCFRCAPLYSTNFSLVKRMALHLLMYFTHWTNLHMQPAKLCRVTQTHARWIFSLLSRVDDYVSADDMHLLRNLARAHLALLKDLIHSKTERVADDINPGSCWLIISTVVGIWGQRDLWVDAEDVIRSRI